MILVSFIETKVVHACVARMIITLNHFVMTKDFGAANHLKAIAKKQRIIGILKMQSAMARY